MVRYTIHWRNYENESRNVLCSLFTLIKMSTMLMDIQIKRCEVFWNIECSNTLSSLMIFFPRSVSLPLLSLSPSRIPVLIQSKLIIIEICGASDYISSLQPGSVLNISFPIPIWQMNCQGWIMRHNQKQQNKHSEESIIQCLSFVHPRFLHHFSDIYSSLMCKKNFRFNIHHSKILFAKFVIISFCFFEWNMINVVIGVLKEQ